jgi:DNA polymerase-1
MPPDLAEQIPFVHEACEALGVPIITYEGVEADDVLGTLAQQGADRGLSVALVTGDKDFFQLVTEKVLVFNPRDDGTWFDIEAVVGKFGVHPSQVIDVLALMGDSIDNVKGVPSIGEKGARDLIAAYGSLEELLARAGELTQRKYREALLTHSESARHSRELVRLRTDVPVSLELEKLRYQGARRECCFDLFSRLGFRSLVVEYAPTAETVSADYQTVKTLDQFETLTSHVRNAGRCAFHVVMDPPAGFDARVIGLAVATEARRAWWVPLRTGPSNHATAPDVSGAPAGVTGDTQGEHLTATVQGQGNLFGAPPTISGGEGATADVTKVDAAAGWPLDVVRRVLGPALADARIEKVGHDTKTSALALNRLGLTIHGIADDTMLASYLLDATRSTHSLESLALDELGYKATDDEALRGKGVRAVAFDALAEPAVRGYACERADLVSQLAPRLIPSVDRERLTSVYRELELPLVPVLMALEQTGIAVDVGGLGELGVRVQRELDAKCHRIYQLAGVEFNINSPRQLSEVLFDKLQLPASKKTGKTRTASTAVEVLEELALVHELPREILDWRALSKLKGTYIDALPILMRRDTGRVHTTFNQAVAATGRLSSSDPNLQNIPIRTQLGREIRRAFVAAPGYRLISADYSQIELRVLAHLSGDESLIDAFTRGEDIHDRTARNVFGADSPLDRYELRRRAKIINYALLYGKTAFTLAKDIGVTQQAAQDFIEAYFNGFPAVRRFIDDTLARARERGVVTTMTGRRRLVPEITSRNGQVRSAAERIAVNMPIQGSAADILKRAMIDVHDALQTRPGGWDGARMILTVHDELLFEVRDDEVDAVMALVSDRMEHAASLAVPLTVDVGSGRNWMEAKG